jgi:hypothetical protein
MIYHSCDEGSWRQSLLSTTRCCDVCGRNLFTGLTSAASPRVDISSTCRVGQKFGVSLPLLTWSPSAWPSRLLYHRGRKSWRDFWITLYVMNIANVINHMLESFKFKDGIDVPKHWAIGSVSTHGFHVNMAAGDLGTYSGLLLGRGSSNFSSSSFLDLADGFAIGRCMPGVGHVSLPTGTVGALVTWSLDFCSGHQKVKSSPLGDRGRLQLSDWWLAEEWPPEGGGREKRTGMIPIYCWSGFPNSLLTHPSGSLAGFCAPPSDLLEVTRRVSHSIHL